MLLVGEPRVVLVAGEGHVPDAGDEALGADAGGGGLHAGGIGAVRVDALEDLGGTVAALAVLPVVVDLNVVEAVGFQLAGGEGGELADVGLVGGAAVGLAVPGAVSGQLRAELDLVGGGGEVGPLLEAEADVVEETERERFLPRRSLPGSMQQTAVVGLGGKGQRVAVAAGEEDAVAALEGGPAGDQSGAGGRDRRGRGRRRNPGVRPAR